MSEGIIKIGASEGTSSPLFHGWLIVITGAYFILWGAMDWLQARSSYRHWVEVGKEPLPDQEQQVRQHLKSSPLIYWSLMGIILIILLGGFIREEEAKGLVKRLLLVGLLVTAGACYHVKRCRARRWLAQHSEEREQAIRPE